MAVAAAEPHTSYDEWRTRRWRLTSLALALLWLVVAAATVLIGEKRSDLSGDPTTYLRGFDPDVQVSYSDPTGFQEWRGWRGPGWVATLAFAAWFGTVLLLIGGPEPWRATRWAWGWFVLMAGPLGSLGYLLLGGPLGLARPKDLHHRLTGGWAFLIALVFFGGANAG